MSRTEAALVDDMNVLMYGVLQFSETLHHTHQNTEAKLSRIAHGIKGTESLVQHLGQDTEQTIHSERQIKDRLSVIQVRTDTLLITSLKHRRLLVLTRI